MAATTSAAELDGEAVSSFVSEGYAVMRGLLSAEEVLKMREIHDALYSRAWEVLESNRDAAAEQLGASSSLGRVVLWSEKRSRFTFDTKPGVAASDAASEPSRATLGLSHVAAIERECPSADPIVGAGATRLISLAARLLGGGSTLASMGHESVSQIIQQVHFKEPGSGTAFPWHQDSKFRREAFGWFTDVTGGRTGSYVNIAIAIDGETESNGPLKVIPGSHRSGHLGGEAGLDPASVDEEGALAPLLQPGDALAIGPWTVHGSGANRDATRWRRSVVVGFAIPSAILREPSADEPSMSLRWERPVPAGEG